MNACMSSHQDLPPMLSSQVKVALSITCSMCVPDASFPFMISHRLFVSAAHLIAPLQFNRRVWLTAGLHSRAERKGKTLPFWADRAETGSRHPACVAVSYTPANLIQHGTFLWSIFPINFQWHIITTCNHLQHRHSSLCVQKTSAEKTNTLEDSVIFTKKGNKSTNVVLDMSCATTVQVYSTKADLQMTSCKRIATSI